MGWVLGSIKRSEQWFLYISPQVVHLQHYWNCFVYFGHLLITLIQGMAKNCYAICADCYRIAKKYKQNKQFLHRKQCNFFVVQANSNLLHKLWTLKSMLLPSPREAFKIEKHTVVHLVKTTVWHARINFLGAELNCFHNIIWPSTEKFWNEVWET